MAQHGWVMKKKGKKSCDTLPLKNYLCSVQVHCVLYCICIKGSWQHQTKHRKLFDMIQYVPSTQCILIGRGPHLAGYIHYSILYERKTWTGNYYILTIYSTVQCTVYMNHRRISDPGYYYIICLHTYL